MNQKQKNSRCLFSNQILTSLSLFPAVAKSVLSGEKAIWVTGAAVLHFQTHSQAGESSSIGKLGKD